MDISATGNFMLIIKKGKAKKERCVELWEEIVTRNAEENGNYAFMNFFRALKEFHRLTAEHSLVEAITTKLRYKVDIKLAKYLTKRGYFIDLTNSDKYANSLYIAIRKCEGLKTRITMKRNEIAGMSDKNGKPETFNQVMGGLIALLGQHVPDDVTLARYNEFKKFIQQKYKDTAKRGKPAMAK